jgi:hypothetical protein
MTVFANGLEISAKAQGCKVIADFPDTCFTPPQTPATPPGVPVPYPDFGQDSDMASGSTTVKIGGKEIGQENKSKYSKCSGDEAGAAPKKGIITSKNTGAVYAQKWSMDVKVQGKGVPRFTDIATSNHACNPPDAPPTILVSTAGVPYSQQHPCLVGKHGDIVKECGKRSPKSEAHHVIPDRVYRANVTGQKNLVQFRVKDAPRYSEGIAVCIPKSGHIAPRGPGGAPATVHHHLDNALEVAGAGRTPPNIAPVGEIRVRALSALQNLVPDPLSMDCFQQTVLKVYAQTDPIAGKTGRTSQGKLTAGSSELAAMVKQGLG